MKDEVKQINKKMAAHLRTIRQDEGFTMRKLSDVIGTPHSFVGKIEQQGRRLDVGEFIIYVRAMGKDPAKVLETIIDL